MSQVANAVQDAPFEGSVTQEMVKETTQVKRGRRTNKDRGLGEPAYMLRLKRQAAARNMTVEQLLQSRIEKREAAARNEQSSTEEEVKTEGKVRNQLKLPLPVAAKASSDATNVQPLSTPMETPQAQDVIEEVRVKHTNDYDLFKWHPANRPILQSTLRKLKAKIIAKNMLNMKPILVNKKMEIVDGQHRYSIAKELGLTLFYIVGDVNDKEMLDLNANQKSLVLTDYLHSYVQQGLEEYIKVEKFVNDHKIMLYAAISLLSGRKSQANSELVESFKEGNFKIRDLEHAERILSIRDKMQPFAPDFYQQRKFTNAVALVVSRPAFDEERLMNSLTKSGHGQIQQAISTELIAKQILKVYNYNRPAKNHLHLS